MASPTTSDKATWKNVKRFVPPDKPFNKFGYFFAHKAYVAPAVMVAKLIEDHHYIVQAKVSPMTEAGRYHAEYDDEGWIEQLTWEMAQYMKTSKGAVLRRMYDIRHGKAKVCHISFAEAVCESFGMNMEIETNIPTLPGNKILAADLVSIRAEMEGVELSKRDLAKYAEQAWRLSAIIVRNPDRLERVQDMAPFNCLRNYAW